MESGLFRSAFIAIVILALLPAFNAEEGEGAPSMDWWNVDIEALFSSGSGPQKEMVGFGPLMFDPADWNGVRSSLPEGECETLFIVQLRSPDDLDVFLDSGPGIVEIFSPLTFLIFGPLNIDDQHVRAYFPYHPLMKMDPGLFLYSRDMDGVGDVLVEVGLYLEPDDDLIGSLGGPDNVVLIPQDGIILGTSKISDLYDIAKLDVVSFLAIGESFEVDNDVASGILDVSEVRSLLGLDGTGQIVAVADTGLDTGSNATMHPDFNGRIIRAYAYARTNNWSDPDIHFPNSSSPGKGGHGTHVAGSVLGDGSASNGTYSGMAPNASLVMQSTMLSTGSLSIPAYFTLFNDAYNSGARIHTNSWSSRTYLGNYTSIKSWHIDNFVWGHSNMTILFSAGNKGPAPYTVSTQSSSKNVISVGASESYRPNLSSSANNISQMASFSSRGYVYNDGRVKPDVVAPGTYILSTRSSLIPDPWNHYWGWQSLYSTLNSRYAYNGGTSMSTPIVAGTTALIRQYFQDIEDLEDPSAALIKASIINGARPLNGNWSSIPNRNEGWGLVNATNSICTEESDAGVLRYVDDKTGITTGSTHSRKYTISSNGPDAILTLVWSDYPGSNTSSIKLVNDLDITITGPDGTIYHGNDLSAPYNGSHDRINNVERIRIPGPTAGIYTVNITGYSVSQGPQPYAVVMTGDFTGAVASLSFVEERISSSGGVATIGLADSNLTGNGYQLVKVNSTTDPTGEMVNLTEMIQGGGSTGIFRGSVTVTTGTPAVGEVRVSADEDLFVHYQESYPTRALTATTHVLLQPAIISITHDSEGRNLTYQDTVVAIIKGTPGWAASMDVVNITTLKNMVARDDGSFPDAAAGDGNYTASFSIPNLLEGNFTIKGRIIRPYLAPTVGYSTSPLYINTNIPRVIRNLSISPVPAGNSLHLTWDLPKDPNLQSLRIFRAVEDPAGSGEPGLFSHIHTTPDARTYFTDMGLEDGRPYFYRIRTYNILGYISAYSDLASGVPSDSTPPWIELLSPANGDRVRGTLAVNHSAEMDTDHVLIEGANDHNDDGSADTPWVLLVNDTDPSDPAYWDTTSLPEGIDGGETILIRGVAVDEAGNFNRSAVVGGLHIDNDPVRSIMVTSPLVYGSNVSVYNLQGITEPFGRVLVKSGSRVVGQGAAGPTGVFSIYVPLTQGETTLVVEVYDDIGNGPLIFDEVIFIVFDEMPPEAVISLPGMEPTTSGPFVIDGSASFDEGPDSPFSGIVNHTWTVSFRGVSWVEYGSSLAIHSEAPGILSVLLEVSDFCGNSDTLSVDLEIIDDILPILAPMEDMIVDEDVMVSLSPEGYSDNDPDLDRSGLFTWTFTGPWNHSMRGESVQLSFDLPGIYDARVELTDGSGNMAASSFNITVRDITSPVIGHLGDLFVIKGSTALLDGSGIQDNDPIFPLGANFSWTFTDLGTRYYGYRVEYVTEALGQFKVTIAVRDGGGNKVYGAFILHVIDDGIPPEAIGSDPPDGARNISLRPTITIRFDEDMDQVSYMDGISILDGFGENVPFDVDLTMEDRRAIVIDTQLDPGKDYTVKLSNSLLDITGTSILPWSFSFSTISRMEVLAVNGGSFDRNDPIFFIFAGDLLDLTFTDDIGSDSLIAFIGPGEIGGSFEYIIDQEGATMSIRIPEDLPEGRYELFLGNVSSVHGVVLDTDVVILLDVGWRPDEVDDGGGTSLGLLALLAIVTLIIVSFIIVVMISRRRRGTDAPPEGHRGPPLEPDHILDHEHHHLHPGHHLDGEPGPGTEDEGH